MSELKNEAAKEVQKGLELLNRDKAALENEINDKSERLRILNTQLDALERFIKLQTDLRNKINKIPDA